MTGAELFTLSVRLRSLAVFRNLLNDTVVEALCRFLESARGDTAQAVSCYAEFVSRLYAAGGKSLARYLKTAAGDDENPYIRMIGQSLEPWEELVDCVRSELEILQAAADLTPEGLREALDWQGYLPVFRTETVDIAASYRKRCENIGKFGYGIYARHHMFYLGSEGQIIPVHNPDKTRLSSLIDYEREKKIILDNTLALLEGRPAANILLTGDAGTGKSSTVKAVVNELSYKGLRILEVRKEQLRIIPAVIDALNSNPLKFILFIDDLSFQKDDDNFSALKAILEGSVSAKASNIVIYATSNRRHLVRESFSERDGDDVHRNDTMQQLVSLSERFGIHVTFQKPDKKTYLNIVRHLARERGIDMDEQELDILAERFALSRGRSARAATQFVDSLLSSK